MKFNKYSKIENTYREKEIEYVRSNGLDIGLWAVVEKIHGSNFSIITDGNKLEIAKRTSTIQLNKHGTCSFFNAHKILDRYGEDIKDLYDGVKDKLDEDNQGIDFIPTYIQVYGELFGGNYPHEEVENSNHSVKVQNGVWYHPDNEFMIFDVVVGFNDGDRDTRRFLPEMFWREIVGDLGLSVKPAPLIFSGDFQECLDHSCEFDTYVPGVFGLPDIEDNICEGIVIKPVIPRFRGNGSRVIFKKKNDRFKEKSRAKKVKKDKQITENTKIAMEAASEYITENRLNNVISKHGEIKDWSEFGFIMREFIHDVMEDFSLESGSLLNVLEKKEQKQLNKHIGSLATPIIKSIFRKTYDVMKTYSTRQLFDEPVVTLKDIIPNWDGNLNWKGTLDLSYTRITELPDNLTVHGSLNLSYTPITELPDNLEVGYWIYVSKGQLAYIPEHLKDQVCENKMKTYKTKQLFDEPAVTLKDIMPEWDGDLNWIGDLILVDTSVTELPSNLTVGHGLYLGGTPITELPDGLTVEGPLCLDNTPITELPDDLRAYGSLYLQNSQITELPDSLKVEGNLNLQDTPMAKLPNNLTVGNSLYLSDSKITELPDNLTVGGWVYVSKGQLTYIPYHLEERIVEH